jgi:hypothetical protein
MGHNWFFQTLFWEKLIFHWMLIGYLFKLLSVIPFGYAALAPAERHKWMSWLGSIRAAKGPLRLGTAQHFPCLFDYRIHFNFLNNECSELTGQEVLPYCHFGSLLGKVHGNLTVFTNPSSITQLQKGSFPGSSGLGWTVNLS